MGCLVALSSEMLQVPTSPMRFSQDEMLITTEKKGSDRPALAKKQAAEFPLPTSKATPI